MQDAYLTTYLNDHLGMSVAGIELTRRCLSNNREGDLGKFLAHLLLVLEENHVLVRKLLKRLGAKESEVKKLGGWVLEKAGRLKLNNALFRYSDLARVIELETLVAGLQAQASMWTVLASSRSGDPRLDGIDFEEVRNRAEQMLEEARRYHLCAAAFAFTKK